MTDKLKQFIDDNRESFDSAVPDSRVYERIREQLSGNENKKKHNWRSFRWAALAAGILGLSVASYFIFGKNNKHATESIAIQPGTDKEDNTYSGDAVYAKQIYHFRELIGLQQAELKELKNEYPELYKQFVTDINQLDSSYQSLKIKLAENPNREMLLEAMIQNLQLQSELLTRQLMITKQIKQKSQNHEKNSI
jgi:hypothetical protein